MNQKYSLGPVRIWKNNPTHLNIVTEKFSIYNTAYYLMLTWYSSLIQKILNSIQGTEFQKAGEIDHTF